MVVVPHFFISYYQALATTFNLARRVHERLFNGHWKLERMFRGTDRGTIELPPPTSPTITYGIMKA